MNEKQRDLAKKLLANIEDLATQLKSALNGEHQLDDIDIDKLLLDKTVSASPDSGKIIEGVFNGQVMIGPDGKNYSVPPNYASKSKLVEGDILKLTINPDGSFIYKQIQPVERDRLVGKLVKDKETGEFRALVKKKLYKLLLASVTYFKGDVGDEVVLLVPKETPSNWAAVENIIKS